MPIVEVELAWGGDEVPLLYGNSEGQTFKYLSCMSIE